MRVEGLGWRERCGWSRSGGTESENEGKEGMLDIEREGRE